MPACDRPLILCLSARDGRGRTAAMMPLPPSPTHGTPPSTPPPLVSCIGAAHPQSASVPCVSWSGSGVTVEKGAGGIIDVDDATFERCCVKTADEALEVAERVGYPIMIKASEGGGGKGVRKATEASQIRAAFQQACARARAPAYTHTQPHGRRNHAMTRARAALRFRSRWRGGSQPLRCRWSCTRVRQAALTRGVRPCLPRRRACELCRWRMR